MAAIHSRIILPPSRTICMLYAVILLFGTNVTLVILRTMMTYADGPVVMSSDFNVHFPASRLKTITSAAAAFGCGYIGNGSLEIEIEQVKCKRKVLRAALSLDLSGALEKCGFREEYEAAIKGTPIQPLKYLINPCWLSKVDTGSHTRLDSTTVIRLRCLPSVLVMGSGRSGVKDLGRMLSLHPALQGPYLSNYQPWIDTEEPDAHQGVSCSPFSKYVDIFNENAQRIRQTSLTSTFDSKDGPGPYQEGVIFGIAPRYIQGQIGSEPLMLNTNKTVSYLPQTVKLVTPELRLIFMFRDPTERLFSEFCTVYSQSKHDIDVAKTFDSSIREAIIIWHQCVKQYDEVRCTHDLPLVANRKHRLILRMLINSLYYLHTRSWLDVFPLSQVLFIKSDDYFANRTRSLEEVARFIGVRSFPAQLAKHIAEKTVINEGRRTFMMWDKTRRVIGRFFDVYNRQLSSLLRDRKFLWPA